jgi:AcrR family transcriptional regulator
MTKAFQASFAHGEALLEAALTEFAVYGYEQASINRILAKANMSKGQFYYHFKNKEGLYFSLISLLIERKQAHLKEAMHPRDMHQDLFSIFTQQIRLGLDFARQQPAVSRFAERFAREQGSHIYAKALKRFNFAGDAAMSNLIERAYQAGELRNDLPLPFMKQVIAFLFTHAVEVCGLGKGGADDIERTLNHLVSFIRGGVAANKAVLSRRRRNA